MSKQAKIPNLKNSTQVGWRYTDSIILSIKVLAMATGLSQSDVATILLSSVLRRFEGKKLAVGGMPFEMPKLFDDDESFGFAEIDKWVEVFEGSVAPWDPNPLVAKI